MAKFSTPDSSCQENLEHTPVHVFICRIKVEMFQFGYDSFDGTGGEVYVVGRVKDTALVIVYYFPLKVFG